MNTCWIENLLGEVLPISLPPHFIPLKQISCLVLLPYQVRSERRAGAPKAAEGVRTFDLLTSNCVFSCFYLVFRAIYPAISKAYCNIFCLFSG